MTLGLLALAFVLAGASPVAGPTAWLGPAPPAQVRRVVTLVPSLTDTVLALGAGALLVGVSRFDERTEVAALPRVGGFVDPSVEAVVALRPDLLLVQPGPGNRRPVETLAETGVPVLLLRLENVEDVLAAFRAVGKALDRPERGEALARQFEQTRASVRARARALPPVRVLFVHGFQPLVVAGPGSFVDALLSDAGGRNAAADATRPYPLYSVERALLSRPEVVIDGADTAEGKDALRGLPGLASARWVTLPSRNLLHPGPALARGLEELFALLHPSAADGGVR